MLSLAFLAAGVSLGSPAGLQDESAAPAVPLVRWERTLDDAERLSRATGRPLLVCVNMDGEPASEAYANRRYTDPDFAALTERFVPVIVSPDRHNPFDHDERGRRVECPRFGRVTCGEHIGVEAAAFERYFSGERYAPRHVGVSPAGEILFDLFLQRDLSVVDRKLGEHGPAELVADGSVTGGAAKDGTADGRAALERAYLAAGSSERTRLLMQAARSEAEPYDLVRLGLEEDDRDLRRVAVLALAACARESGLDLLLAVRARVEDADQDRLLAEALHRIAGTSERAAALERLETGATARVDAPRVVEWLRVLASAPFVPARASDGDLDRLAERLDSLAELEDTHPGDPTFPLEQARTALAFAEALIAQGQDPSFPLEDAARHAARALERGAPSADALGLEARARWLANDLPRAAELALAATPGWLARAGEPGAAAVMEVLARGRAGQLYALSSPGSEEGDGIWAGQVDAAFDVLRAHPLGTESHAVAHADLLGWLGLLERRGDVLLDALRRFPTSSDLHSRFRAHVQAVHGPFALGRAYDRREDDQIDLAAWSWFAGYAYLVEAEQRVRAADAEGARVAYGSAIERFLESEGLQPSYADTARHYAAMAHAGRARLSLERGAGADDLADAMGEIATGLELRPSCAEWEDGLGRKPLETLQLLRGALAASGLDELDAELEARVGAAAPELWERATPLDAPPTDRLEAARRARLDWSRLSGNLDTDADGRVSSREWRGDPAAFERLDADGDGFLTLPDLLAGGR